MPPAPGWVLMLLPNWLLAPLILVGNGNPSSALHSLGDGCLPQLLLQAPPAAGLEKGGWEERERELLLGEGRRHCPCTGTQPYHKTESQTSRADLHEGTCLVPAGQGGAGGQLGGRGVAEVGGTHLPCDQRDVRNGLCCRDGWWELNVRTGTCQEMVTLAWCSCLSSVPGNCSLQPGE